MQNCFFIRVKGSYVRVGFDDILYIEGCRNYARVVTPGKVFLASITLKRMEELLPGGAFLRVHKSFIVALAKVYSFNAEQVLIVDKEIPVGMHYRGVIERSVLILQETAESRSARAGNGISITRGKRLSSGAASQKPLLENINYSKAI